MHQKAIIVRGLPGSGKSTFAKNVFPNYNHFEADMFHTDEEGNYNFDISKIKESHQWCFDSFCKSLLNGCPTIVTNTFTTMWELEKYLTFLKDNSIEFLVVRMNTSYGSIHNVPEETVQKMTSRFQDYPGEIIINESQSCNCEKS